jgi:hypothetical protein
MNSSQDSEEMRHQEAAAWARHLLGALGGASAHLLAALGTALRLQRLGFLAAAYLDATVRCTGLMCFAVLAQVATTASAIALAQRDNYLAMRWHMTH